MNCPFCDIISEKTRVLEEKNYVRVIFSNPRLMKGHLLIVPKRHVEKISELDDYEQQELFKTIIEYQEKILSQIASGCDIRQNYRPFQEQSNLKLNHMHIHLQPRELFDELYEKCQIYEGDVFKELSKEEIEDISKKLR